MFLQNLVEKRIRAEKLNRFVEIQNRLRQTNLVIGTYAQNAYTNIGTDDEVTNELLAEINTFTDEDLDAMTMTYPNWDGFNKNMQVDGLFSLFYESSKKSLKVCVPFTMIVLTITQWKDEMLLARYWQDFRTQYRTEIEDNVLEDITDEQWDNLRNLLEDNCFDLNLFNLSSYSLEQNFRQAP